MQLESNGRGVRWSSINAVITYQGDFSAASVFIMLTVDVFFYGILTWYLDKVRFLVRALQAFAFFHFCLSGLCILMFTQARS